ncbi:type III secretion system stator protein SctL [Burkholderia sp. AW33-5]
MGIWLRRPRVAEIAQVPPDASARLGFSDDVVPRECFGELMSIESAYAALDEDRDAVLAAARQEAEGVIADAVARTQELIAAARSEYDAAAERGYRDGYDQAFGKWLDRLAEVADIQNQLQLRMRERLADIVASAVEQIVRAESRETLFERALASVERIVDGATYLRVLVHADDLDHAKEIFGTLEERWREFGRPIPMSVEADKRLAPGSCICESDFGTIDASLDTQLRAMRGAVARALKRSMEVAGADDVDTTRSDGSIDAAADRNEGRDRQEAEQDATEAEVDASRGAET